MLPRTLEPEVMDTPEEARDYDAMDHCEVNRVFVADFLHAARALVPAGIANEVLDVGTGTSLIPLELCRRTAAWSVTAIDLAGEMLALAARNVAAAGLADRIRLERVDAKGLPFEEGRFPAVMSNSIVHHIPEPLHAVREMLRVLRPGGLLFVRDLLRPDTAAQVERFVATYAGNENEHSQTMFRNSLHAALTLDEVRTMLEACGAPAEWAQQTSDRHWTIAGIKP